MLHALPLAHGPLRPLRDHVPDFMLRLSAELGLCCSCEVRPWQDAAVLLERSAQQALRVFTSAGNAARLPVRQVAFPDGPGAPVTGLAAAAGEGATVVFDEAAGGAHMHPREAFLSDVGAHTTTLAWQQLELPSFGEASCVLCETPCGEDGGGGQAHACEFWAAASAALRGEAARRTVLVFAQDALFATPAPHVPRACLYVVTPLAMLLAIMAAVDLLVCVIAPHKRKLEFASAFGVPRMEALPVCLLSLERVLQHYRPLLADAPAGCEEDLFRGVVAFAASVARRGGLMLRARGASVACDSSLLPKLHPPLRAPAAALERWVAALRRGRIRMLRVAQRADGAAAAVEAFVCEHYGGRCEALLALLRRGLAHGPVRARWPGGAPAGQSRITSFVRCGGQEALARAVAAPLGADAALLALLCALQARFPAAQRRFFEQTLVLSAADLARASDDEHVLLQLRFLAHLCASNWHALAPDAAGAACAHARLADASL